MPQKLFAEELAAFAPFRSGDSVTELGAGTGFLTAALCKQGVQVEATDESSSMLEIGRQLVPKARWALRNAFGEIASTQAIASSGVLQWAPEPSEVLQRWRSALPVGGRLLLGVPCNPCLCELRAIVGDGKLRWRSKEQWLDFVAQAKFVVRKHRVLQTQFVYTSALDFMRHLHRSGITGEPRLSFSQFKSLLRKYDHRHSCDGGVFATWTWLLVDALASE